MRLREAGRSCGGSGGGSGGGDGGGDGGGAPGTSMAKVHMCGSLNAFVCPHTCCSQFGSFSHFFT
jgi:hypothetical protein